MNTISELNKIPKARNSILKSKLTWLLLLVIVIMSTGLRVYKLDSVPPALSWDEAAVGYNAYTIANWGRDEWGNSWPVFFKSFEDDKSPVHVYFTALSIKLLGLNEVSTRLPSAFFGALSVLAIFYLTWQLFGSRLISIFAAFLIGLSPYSLQFSRFNHELNFALTFFMLGVALFLHGIKKYPALLPLSATSFGLSILSYHSSKLVVPPIILLLTIIYFRELKKAKKYFYVSSLILVIVSMVYLFNPNLLGTSRAKQLVIPEQETKQSTLFLQTGNSLLGDTEVVIKHYLTHYQMNYLFISGDQNQRHSTQKIGQFYIIEGLLFVIGLIVLLLKRSKVSLLMISWLLLAPLPSSLSGGVADGPHAARSLFMLGSWQILAAVGFGKVIDLLKRLRVQILFVVLVICLIGGQFYQYIYDYYGKYPLRSAGEWQYGMKQIVQFVGSHQGFEKVYMTAIRSQPYIFFLYYLKTPLPEFLDQVYYNETAGRPSNLVKMFNKYNFGNWDEIESAPDQLVLYIVEPSKYSGLKYKPFFDIKELVKYPDGGDAYYLVSYP